MQKNDPEKEAKLDIQEQKVCDHQEQSVDQKSSQENDDIVVQKNQPNASAELLEMKNSEENAKTFKEQDDKDQRNCDQKQNDTGKLTQSDHDNQLKQSKNDQHATNQHSQNDEYKEDVTTECCQDKKGTYSYMYVVTCVTQFA